MFLAFLPKIFGHNKEEQLEI